MTKVPNQILLVEDDPEVRKLIVHFLTADGREVIAADGPDQARQILSARSDIDLAILDFWLGQETAVGLIDELRTTLQGVPIVIISGGSPLTDLGTTQANADLNCALAFVQKPFRKVELLDAVAAALR